MNASTAALAKPNGPIVWLDMDQGQLDDAYDQLVYAPNRDRLTKRRVTNSAAARADRRPAAPCLRTDRRSKRSTSISRSRVTLPLAPARQSRSSCTAGPGVLAPHPSSRSWPSRSCAPAPISRCSISSTWTMLAAIYVRWWSKYAVPWVLSVAMPKNSAATATGFI